jgi:hypothetical protein
MQVLKQQRDKSEKSVQRTHSSRKTHSKASAEASVQQLQFSLTHESVPRHISGIKFQEDFPEFLLGA